MLLGIDACTQGSWFLNFFSFREARIERVRPYTCLRTLCQIGSKGDGVTQFTCCLLHLTEADCMCVHNLYCWQKWSANCLSGDSPKMGAVPLIQGSHALPNRLHHQQIVHSSQSGLPNGGQNGTMHPQGGHRMQDGIVHQHQAGHPPQNGMGMGPQQTANSACSGGGFSHQQLGQGGSMGIPQQQMRLPSPLRELQVSSQAQNTSLQCSTNLPFVLTQYRYPLSQQEFFIRSLSSMISIGCVAYHIYNFSPLVVYVRR